MCRGCAAARELETFGKLEVRPEKEEFLRPLRYAAGVRWKDSRDPDDAMPVADQGQAIPVKKGNLAVNKDLFQLPGPSQAKRKEAVAGTPPAHHKRRHDGLPVEHRIPRPAGEEAGVEIAGPPSDPG